MKITDEMIYAAYCAQPSVGTMAIEEILTAALSASPAGVVKPLDAEEYRKVMDAAIAAYEANTPPTYRYSATALCKAVEAAFAARIMSAVEPAGVGVEDVGDPEAWLFHEPPPQTNFPGNAHVLFGLDAQGHIPAVEAALAEGVDWQEIGNRIGWCGETAKQYYERHLARAALKGDEQ